MNSALYQAIRRYLPQRVKYYLKRILVRRGLAKPTAHIPISPNLLENRLIIETAKPYFTANSQVATWQAPHASIIMITHNQFHLTHLCLEALYYYTQWPSFELIAVDNRSRDATRAYFQKLQNILPNFRMVLNFRNEGFARASNQGIMRSCGNYIVLLNNDTIVTPGWLSRLIKYLESDPTIGMIGPVTNSAGNEQMIPASYQNLEELEGFAQQRAEQYKGQTFEIDMLAMFCVVISRRVIDQVGLLDERFELGTFEDDDFCYRVKSLGYKLICAEDVFVHHFGKATIGKLDDEKYMELFERNRKKFEQKWGVRWRPHRLYR